MNPLTFKCPLCTYENENLVSLSVHYRKTHNSTAKQLRIMLFHTGIEPTCGCGCGSPVKFDSIVAGFRGYVRGHHQRVNNNFANSKEGLKKSQDVRREMHKRGEIKIWNKGETKETDERLKLLGEKTSQTILSDPEKIAKRSIRMRKGRLDGTVPTMKGKDHSQWKGGTSVLSMRCHGSARLFKEWKYSKLKSSGFACQRCSSTSNLQVHHDAEKMSSIIKMMNDKFNPTMSTEWEITSKIVDAVVDYHIENNVSGEVICKACHKAEHPKMNFK